MNGIDELVGKCAPSERDMIELMLRCAGDYIRAAVRVEIDIINLPGFDLKETRLDSQLINSACESTLDALIISVNAVNGLCDKYGTPHIYTGGTERREYGDFALKIVTDVLTKNY